MLLVAIGVAVAAVLRVDALLLGSGPAGELLVVDREGRLSIVLPNASAIALVTGRTVRPLGRTSVAEDGSGVAYRWPAWSPDGRRVAAMRITSKGGLFFSAEVVTLDLATGAERAVHRSELSDAVYIQWSPTGRQIAMLLPEPENLLGLWVAPADGRARARPLVQGQPLYFAWSPRGDRLAVHVNGDFRASSATVARVLLVEDPAGDARVAVLSLAPNAFRAPSWSSIGDLILMAGREDSAEVIAVMQPDGNLAGHVPLVERAPAFLWSPTGGQAVVAPADMTGTPYAGLDLFRPGRNRPRRLVRGPVQAFFWSPDGRAIAYVTPGGADRLDWWITDLNGRSRRIATFVPTVEFQVLLNFFDQFAQGTAVWSPDGRALAFAGWQPGERQEGTPTVPSRVFVVPIDGAPPRAVATGVFATWSPR
ncbi:MAG: PD40 domain-containing protein [Chloroflexi bacterium]|nr:PD40 domain-containing protein [Chloroflexota bacterium]